MTTLSLHKITLPRPEFNALQRKAKLAGQTVPQYVRSLVEQDILADKPFDNLLHPIREDFRTKGVTETQLHKIVMRGRHKPVKQRSRSHRKFR